MVANLDCDNILRNELDRGLGTWAELLQNTFGSVRLVHSMKVDRSRLVRDRIRVRRLILVCESKDHPQPNYGRKETQIHPSVGECKKDCESGTPSTISFDFEADVVLRIGLRKSYLLGLLETANVLKKLANLPSRLHHAYHLKSFLLTCSPPRRFEDQGKG